MSPDPKGTRAEVDGLAAELAGLEALNARHEAAATEAARAHRAGKLDAEALQAATSAAAAVAYALDQTRADLEAARVALAEAESAAEDEAHLAVIARATVEYNEAERDHRAMLDGTEHAIAAAIIRSGDLMRAAAAAKTQARAAARALATKHGTDEADALARAVNGSDVPALKPDANVTKWPHGSRQTWRLVSQVKARTLGVKAGA